MPARARNRLAEYQRRRDFRKTAEPEGARAKTGAGRRFVVQKHDARRLHYDFRLEHDGVLKSWAVTKGPSLDPGDKRLAVRTEDHPLEYGGFEGVIPEGQYGAGAVMLWDAGAWEPNGDPDEGLAEGTLKFWLHGERMSGGWALVRMKPRRGEKRENWLLIKERDEAAREDGDALTRETATSVETGRTMEEVAQGKAGRKKASNGKSRTKRKGRTKPPAFVKPQLATLVDAVPEGDGWLHEIKYDGYRILASVGGGSVILRTRNGLDWTGKFDVLADALAELPVGSALLDGEVAVADSKGRTDFGALQQALSDGGGAKIGYYLFDLPALEGEDLKPLSQRERKRRLAALLADQSKKGPLFYSDHIEGSGDRMYARACELQLEGVISKRADAPYRSGRTRNWLKVKCGMGQEFVVIGWRPSRKRGRPFSSLLLALREDGELRYRGRVGSGFDDHDFDELSRLFGKRARKTPAAEDVPGDVRRDARFVTPNLVAEIAFRGWTREGYVRQGSFKGLRRDKPAKAVTRERAMTRATTRVVGDGDAAETAEIEGVRVTHPDRVLFPGQGATKRDLIDHYLALAEAMLPHVADRPLALVRCPQGSGESCFYQKHASPGFPDAFRAVAIPEKSGSGDYLYIRDRAGLVAAVQMGVLELHVWGARRDRLERPDRLVFDLDPDAAIGFGRVREAAREMRERLGALGLESFPLATGGKGLHVVVPLVRRHGWQAHKDFAEALARRMAADSPRRYTATMSKAKRKGRIFVDYLRNDRGNTAIAPFSSRARDGAPVAFPVSWEALGRLKDARPAHVGDAAARLKRYGKSPWAGYGEVRQALPLKKLGL